MTALNSNRMLQPSLGGAAAELQRHLLHLSQDGCGAQLQYSNN